MPPKTTTHRDQIDDLNDSMKNEKVFVDGAHTHTRAHAHTRMDTRAHRCANGRMSGRMGSRTNARAHTYARTHARTQARMYERARKHVCKRSDMCMYVRACMGAQERTHTCMSRYRQTRSVC